MKTGKWLAIVGLAGVMALSTQDGFGQERQRGERGGGERPQFDPAQMRQRMMERYKEMLEVTSDDEWNVIEPLVTKVQEVRMQTMGGMGRGFAGFAGRRPGGDQQGGPGGRGGFMGRQADPTADALSKAIDAKASKAELKAALTKYQEARKQKEAELQTAQENLRKVLTARQEAIATLNGLL